MGILLVEYAVLHQKNAISYAKVEGSNILRQIAKLKYLQRETLFCPEKGPFLCDNSFRKSCIYLLCKLRYRHPSKKVQICLHKKICRAVLPNIFGILAFLANNFGCRISGCCRQPVTSIYRNGHPHIILVIAELGPAPDLPKWADGRSVVWSAGFWKVSINDNAVSAGNTKALARLNRPIISWSNPTKSGSAVYRNPPALLAAQLRAYSCCDTETLCHADIGGDGVHGVLVWRSRCRKSRWEEYMGKTNRKPPGTGCSCPEEILARRVFCR